MPNINWPKAILELLDMIRAFFAGLLAPGGTAGGPVTAVQATPDPATVEVGKTIKINAQAFNASGEYLEGTTFTWTTSTPGLTQVDQQGNVTGLASGKGFVTARSPDPGGRQETVEINVVAPVNSVVVTPNPAGVQVGAQLQLVATAKDAANNTIPGKSATWTVADNTVASVGASTGLLVGLKVGTTTVTATIDGKSATINVTVSSSGGGGGGVGDGNFANEPAGMTLLTDRYFTQVNGGTCAAATAKGLDGWGGDESKYVQQGRLVFDAQGFMTYIYPPGLVGGTGPAQSDFGTPCFGPANPGLGSELYIATRLMYGPQFESNGNTNKIFYLNWGMHAGFAASNVSNTEPPSGGSLILRAESPVVNDKSAEARLTWPLYVGITENGSGMSGMGWTQHSQAHLTRGNWHDVELLIKLAMSNSELTTMRIWVDGQRVIEKLNIPPLPSQQDGLFYPFQFIGFRPVWGGGCPNPPNQCSVTYESRLNIRRVRVCNR